MRLFSDAWANGEPIPERFAAARLDVHGRVALSDDVQPPLRWTGLPAGTRSLALICQDFDAPQAADGRAPFDDDAAADARGLPADAPRSDFFHWVLVDLPPELDGLAEGQCGRGFVAGGRAAPWAPPGARHGVNDFTRRFAGDARWAGRYVGYDGPLPPAGDALVHHVVFTLYALDVPRLALEGDFDGRAALAALAPHVLGSATHSGTYTLNRRLRGAGA